MVKPEEKSEMMSTKELLQLFNASLKRHGITGLKVDLEANKLILKQKLGVGLKGLGYDKDEDSLWLCLDQVNSGSSLPNELWNENSFIAKDFYKDVTIMREGNLLHITLAPRHPVCCLTRLIYRTINVCLPGTYNEWRRENFFEPIWEKDTMKLVLDLDKTGPIGECKIAIMETRCSWSSGQWKPGAEQTMVIYTK